jgi:hypothetical protein
MARNDFIFRGIQPDIQGATERFQTELEINYVFMDKFNYVITMIFSFLVFLFPEPFA